MRPCDRIAGLNCPIENCLGRSTPKACDYIRAITAWRAETPEQQQAYFDGRQSAATKSLLAAVRECPDRGGVLPISQQPQNCSKCGELSACGLGKGKTPGRVTLRDCIDCRKQAAEAPPK